MTWAGVPKTTMTGRLLRVGDALDVEFGVGLGDDPPAARDAQLQEGAEGPGHVVQVALRLLGR